MLSYTYRYTNTYKGNFKHQGIKHQFLYIMDTNTNKQQKH